MREPQSRKGGFHGGYSKNNKYKFNFKRVKYKIDIKRGNYLNYNKLFKS